MKKELFADVILPLAVKGRFTYRIPERLAEVTKIGSRVIIRFGNQKLYPALVCNITDKNPGLKNIKEISDLLDASPVINQTQLKFWNWLSEYYMCTLGEVLKAALPSSVTSLVKKGILVSLNQEVRSIQNKETATEPLRELSTSQSEAYNSLLSQLKEKEIILLHGVTSSGKTELYIRLIDEQLRKGKQILYLLPEIALTTQIISRLRRHFGRLTAVFHSKLTDAERIEIWKSVAQPGNGNDIRLIIGARSSLFLPFHDPGLIIIDEEHDSSYKQQDPAPRYNARDSAIMMASLWKAKTILGSATPSVETFYNAFSGKYGYVRMGERYGKINLPEIIIANTREAYRKKQMVSHFSPQLLHVMDEALGKGEQIILFRNRRGFSPYIECSECGWVPACIRCAVNLTYHKEINRLVCHYCGSAYMMHAKCGNCGNISLVTKGFGTEKIEDEIKIVFPEARVARMDQDTTRNKNSVEKIISAFENGQTDILIGTQMISKGLDFENLTVVGILNADGMLNYPDFRAHERAFQMMSQVSGRAGRRLKHGRVIIQTSDPANRVIQMVLNNDFMEMYESQLEERKLFSYPPFCRLVKIILKHKDRSKLNEFSSILGDDLKKSFGARVLGPEFPLVSRIQFWYIKSIIIKVEKDKPMARARELISEAVNKIEKIKGAGSLRINIDVDPY